MAKTVEIKVPDIGDFDDVPVIEVLVSAGDAVEKEQSLITLESEKATMEVPSSEAGVVEELKVAEGDHVSEGDVIAVVKLAAEDGTDAQAAGSDEQPKPKPTDAKSSDEKSETAPQPESKSQAASASPRQESAPPGDSDLHAEVVVLGSGPGGYTAAFRAADLGLNTVLIERYDTLGGVCLNVGCIPSKALLHAAKVIDEAAAMGEHGIDFGAPNIDIRKLHDWEQSVVNKLTGGLAGMAKKRKVNVVTGAGKFVAPHAIEVSTAQGKQRISFDQAIIAAGSEAIKLPGMPWDDPRMMDSADALELEEIPDRMLVIGGGIIGLEMACVYEGLGASITVVEMLEQLMPGTDKDLVRPLARRIDKRYENIFLNTRVTKVEATEQGLIAHFEGDKAPEQDRFDRILVAVGRSPNGNNIGAEAAGVEVSDRGFIPTDKQMRTNVEHIFAIGDIVGQPMLAHKATHEGKVAAEVCAGHKSYFDALVIPSVAYTDPEVAWVGITETQAKEKALEYEKGAFPWAASGRALGIARDEGLTKLLFDKADGRIIGMGAVGPNAGELVAEAALAIEMQAQGSDIGLTIHPHPTLSETVGMAAEAYEGTITDLYMPRR